MFQTSVLMSGSKGNAILIRTAETAILLDAGVSGKAIFAALDSLKISRHQLKGIVVSHEHGDHVSGVGVVARALQIPVYINEETYAQSAHKMGKLPLQPHFFETGTTFEIGNLLVHPFTSSHDAVDSCNFTFRKDGDEERKLGVATDLGYPTRLATEKLRHCSTLVLESNHDVEMLMNGPYDWALKQRVKSNHGHLSNEQAAMLVQDIMHHRLENIVLAHISETNNHPRLALETMQNRLDAINKSPRLYLAAQHEHTPLIDI